MSMKKCSLHPNQLPYLDLQGKRNRTGLDGLADLRQIPPPRMGVGDVREVSAALPHGYSHLVDGLMHHGEKAEKSQEQS